MVGRIATIMKVTIAAPLLTSVSVCRTSFFSFPLLFSSSDTDISNSLAEAQAQDSLARVVYDTFKSRSIVAAKPRKMADEEVDWGVEDVLSLGGEDC